MQAEVTEARQWFSADHEFGVHRLVLFDLIVLSVGLQRQSEGIDVQKINVLS